MATFDIPNPVRRPDIRDVISLIGRAMITLGLILLLFVAYQLWGTNFFEARSQNQLRSQFIEQLEKASSSSTTNPSTSIPGDNPVVTEPTESELAQLASETKAGSPIAVIKIDKIGLDHVVISGTSKSDLQKGPAH